MLPEKIKLPERFDRGELLPPNMDYPYFERVRYTGFSHNKKSFSLENCCFLAEASFVAYNHPGFVKYAFYYAGFENFQPFIGEKVARCFAAWNKDALVLAFRGTEMKGLRFVPGIIADLKISMVKEKNGGLVHSGFSEVLDEIWKGKVNLKGFLDKRKKENPSLKIFLTGHSLGGALSLIAAARYPEADCVYTFGCPRAGNREFGESIKASVFRIVNNNDAITTLPPKRIIESRTGETYSHFGKLKFIDSKGNLKESIKNKFSSGTKEERERFFSLGFEELIFHLGKTRSNDFVDHSPFYYAARLWNACHDMQKNKNQEDTQSP